MRKFECWNYGHLRRLAGAAPLTLLGLALLVSPAAWAQPTNDDFVNALVIEGAFGTITNDTTGATTEPGEPALPSQYETVGGTVWYQWTAPDNGAVEFDTFNSSYDTSLGVFTGTSLATLDQIVANDDLNTTYQGTSEQYFANNGASGVKFSATKGVTYYILVGDKGYYSYGSSNLLTLSWSYLNNSAGVFRFTADQYNYADTESREPYSLNSTAPYSANGARITVTRLFGSAGTVDLSFGITTNGTAVAGTD